MGEESGGLSWLKVVSKEQPLFTGKFWESTNFKMGFDKTGVVVDGSAVVNE